MRNLVACALKSYTRYEHDLRFVINNSRTRLPCWHKATYPPPDNLRAIFPHLEINNQRTMAISAIVVYRSVMRMVRWNIVTRWGNCNRVNERFGPPFVVDFHPFIIVTKQLRWSGDGFLLSWTCGVFDLWQTRLPSSHLVAVYSVLLLSARETFISAPKKKPF